MFNREKFITESLLESAKVKQEIVSSCLESINNASDLICDAVSKGKKILLCGNGGSAADCQHIATEFMIRLSHDLNRPAIAAIALTTDTSNLTAGGNDIVFDNVFARNIEGLGNEGDVLIAISTSGNSTNIIKAIKKAKDKEMKVIILTGGNGGKIRGSGDVTIIVPSENTQRIQEGHITIGHLLCEITERELYSN